MDLWDGRVGVKAGTDRSGTGGVQWLSLCLQGGVCVREREGSSCSNIKEEESGLDEREREIEIMKSSYFLRQIVAIPESRREAGVGNGI